MFTERRDYWQPRGDGATMRVAVGVAIALEGDELAICDQHLQEAATLFLREYGDDSDTILDLENVKVKRLTERNVLAMATALYSR